MLDGSEYNPFGLFGLFFRLFYVFDELFPFEF